MKIIRHSDCPESEQQYLHCCFKIIDEGKELGKITAYLNPYHNIDGVKTMSVGYFVCANDHQVFETLMNAVVKEAKQLNLSRIIGPINGNTWNEYRFVSSTNGQPFLLDVDTPPYYIDLYKKYGFKTLAHYSSDVALELKDNWSMNKLKYDDFIKDGISFEGFDIDNGEKELEDLAELCIEAFSNNFLFSPITKDEFVNKMKAILPIINPRYTLIAKHENRPVGFVFCYQDLYDKVNKTIVVKTLARNSDDRYKGMGSVLSSLVMKNAIVDNFTKGIHALMLISNSSTYISSNFDGNHLRSYELLQLKLNNN